MKLSDRIQAPTPKGYRTVRNAGLAMAAAGATLLASPIALPDPVLQVAGYLAVAGSVASAISQTVTYEQPAKKKKEVRRGNKRPAHS